MAEDRPRAWTRFRSAISGRFVTRRRAEKHPDATVGEQVQAEEQSDFD